jgi:hypothetical protein
VGIEDIVEKIKYVSWKWLLAKMKTLRAYFTNGEYILFIV